MIGTREQVDALAQGYAAAFKARTDIEELGRMLRGIMRKVDAAVLKHNDRQRLADELSRLSGEAQCEQSAMSGEIPARLELAPFGYHE